MVLISVDTLRADRLNAFGYDRRPTSPNIDRLATSGLRFQEAAAPRGATWPSLATVLTGLYPSGHGVYQNQMKFEEQTPTLPKLLQNAGYNTGAFLSNMCNAGHDGWTERDCSSNASDEDLLRNAESWLETVATTSESTATKPVLLWAHFFGAHGPYYNGGDLAHELNPDYSGRLAPKRGVLNRVMTESQSLSSEDLDHLDALYDAAVIGTDRRIGRLLESIDKHLGERTLIVFLSDHGEDLYQHHNYLYHAYSVYQSTLHVPLSITAPGLVTAGDVVSQPVELSDVLPTLLDLLGIERAQQCFHGDSLLGYLAQPNRSGIGKLALSEYGLAPIGTVRQGDWKLIENFETGALELYNLARDIGESKNLIKEKPAKARALYKALKKWRRETNAPVPTQLNPEYKGQ